MRSVEHRLPADDDRGRAARAGRPAERRPGRRRHPRAAAAARRRSTPQPVHRRHRLRTRTSTASTRQRRPARRPARRALVPCTPLGCLMLLRDRLGELAGRDAVVVGRSNIVGKPMAQLLLRESCTVTIAHSRTRDLPAMCRRADILVAAVGRPRDGAAATGSSPAPTVIDVGINRVDAEADGKTRLVGDVDFAEAAARRRRDHAGAGRRRPDDHRLPARQHADRGLPDRGPAEPEGLTPQAGLRHGRRCRPAPSPIRPGRPALPSTHGSAAGAGAKRLPRAGTRCPGPDRVHG